MLLPGGDRRDILMQATETGKGGLPVLEKEWRDYFIKVYVGIGIVIGVPIASIVLFRYGFDKDTILAGMVSLSTLALTLWYGTKYVVPFLPWKRRKASEQSQHSSPEEDGEESSAVGGLLDSLNRHKRSWTGFMIVIGFSFVRILFILLSGDNGRLSRPESAWVYLFTHVLALLLMAGFIPFLWVWAPKFSDVGKYYVLVAILDSLPAIGRNTSLGFLQMDALRSGWWPIVAVWGPILLCWAFYAFRERKSPGASEKDA